MSAYPPSCNLKIMKELLHLNDDCLLELLQYIPFEQLVDLLGKLCHRMDMLIMIQLKRQKHYEIFMRSPPPFNEEQYELIGLSIKSFKISIGYGIPLDRSFQIMRSIFKGAAVTGNLTNFSIHYISWNQECVDIVKPIMPHLECLDASLTDFNSCEQISQLLNVAPKLSVLKMRCLMKPNIYECVNFANLKILEVQYNLNDLQTYKETSKAYPNLEIVVVGIMDYGIHRYWFRGEEIFK